MNPAPELLTTFLRDRGHDAVGPDEDLVDRGILTSMHFVELLFLIEEELGTEISMDEVSTEDFRTISRITRRFFTS